ncbi:MAG: hypothetical protein M1812_002001 [Candelaria pacifica]|nr:MAG: hypothetical protein M1812_002001 [Candelaria pacifica]
MALVLATILLFLGVCITANPLAKSQLQDRSRGPDNVGPINPQTICSTQMGNPNFEDCEQAVRHSVQQFRRSDGTNVWDLDAVFEFYDHNVGPRWDMANAIRLPTITKHRSCNVLLSMRTQDSLNGWTSMHNYKNDKATWDDIKEAVMEVNYACSRGYITQSGGAQIFGEFNAIEIVVFAPWSPQEVLGFDHSLAASRNPVVTLDNNGAYGEEWDSRPWQPPETSSDDDDDSIASDTASQTDVQDRPSYVFQIDTPEDLNAICAVSYTFMYYSTVVLPQFMNILLGVLQMLAPILSGMCQPK